MYLSCKCHRFSHMHWPEGGEKSLEEITSASGGSCGSSFIDSNMRALLMDKLGLPADIASSCVVENMMDTFTEKIKVVSSLQWSVSHVINTKSCIAILLWQ